MSLKLIALRSIANFVRFGPPTLAELRAAREAAGAELQTLAARLNADGYTPTAEDNTAWQAAESKYNAAVAAEEAEAARLQASNARASVNERIRADADRLNAAGRLTLRPDYTPAAAGGRESPRERVAARPRRHGALRAYRGSDALERAERAGMWAAAALYRHTQAAQWCERNGIPLEFGSLVDDDGRPAATLNTNNNAGGGIFVPNEIEYTIQELALLYGVFRQYAEVVPMGSGTKETPRWTGGMTAYFIGETDAPTSSDPAWDLVQLVAKNVGAMTKLSRILDEDSVIDLGDKVTMALVEAFTYLEDNCGFNGDGSSTYGGIYGLIAKILANSAAYATAANGNVTDLTLDLDDFNACVAKLPNYPGLNPVWFMHKTVWANSAQRLQMAAGGVVPADMQNGAGPSLLGYPVVFVNVMDSTPSVSEIAAILGDLRFTSKLGDRRGRTVETGLINDDFTKQLMTILGTQRFAINNHTVTDPRSTSNPGPVIGLKLAAS